MKLSDITVEVRDKTLARIGMIRHEDLDFKLSPTFNNVGAWSLSLAAEHPLTGVLRQPGSGIIITGPSDVIASGPTVKPEFAATPADPKGTVKFEGITDDHILADMLSWPQPSNPDVSTQNVGHDERQGPAESLLHAYVNANVGPSAPAARRNPNLVMGPNLARGPVILKKPRFPVLGELLTEIALLGNLGFRIVQRDDVLVFETYEVTDRSREIRLDINNGTLSSHRVAISPPGATHVIVAGQGEQVDRQFIERTTPESLAAEADWGRRIEFFKDQRNTGVVSELEQSGDEILADQGFTAVAIQAVPMEDTLMRYGFDWGLGDKVSVVVEGQELASTVTGAILQADSEGFKLGAVIGDPTGFNREAAFAAMVKDTERRVGELERNSELPQSSSFVTLDSAQTISGDKKFDGLITGRGADWLTYYARRGATVGGGGVMTWTSAATREFTWSRRFMVGIAQGRDATHSASGYLQMVAPTAGTVIAGVGGHPGATVTSAGVPINWYCALWYAPDQSTSGVGTYYLSSYTGTGSDGWYPPAHWILVAWADADMTSLHVCNGATLKQGQSVDMALVSTATMMTPPLEVVTLGDESTFAWSNASSWSYASDPDIDLPTIVARGSRVQLSGRIKVLTNAAANTAYQPFDIPARFAPASGYKRVHPTVTAMNGGGAVGPLMIGQIVGSLTRPGNQALQLLMYSSQTPAWNTSTWIAFDGSWEREWPL